MVGSGPMSIKLDECLLPGEPGPPYLFVDLYQLDLDNPRTPQIEDPPWEAAFANPNLVGAILKVSQGVSWPKKYSDWFERNFRALGEMFGSDRGSKRFIGGYLYAQFFQNPVHQAELYMQSMERAGWTPGLDIVPILDVEGGGERAANRRASDQQVIDCVAKAAEWLRGHTGKGVMLYGRGLMRDLSIVSKMGCDRVWNPSYTKEMVTNGLTGRLPDGERAPWQLEDIKLWQYGGDGVGDARVHHLPLELKGFGKVDMSVFIAGKERPTLQLVQDGLL